MTPVLGLAVLWNVQSFVDGERPGPMGPYWILLLVYAGFFFEVPDMLSFRNPPGNRPRALLLLIGGLAPWLLAFIAWDRLKLGHVRFWAFWPLLAWAAMAVVISSRQDSRPAGPWTRSFLGAAATILVLTFIYPFVGGQIA